MSGTDLIQGIAILVLAVAFAVHLHTEHGGWGR